MLEINNLGGPNTLKAFNNELIKILKPHAEKLSTISQQRLLAAHAVRILESKSDQDKDVISALGSDIPMIDDFIS
jgi:hypothetical protein